MCQQFPIQKLLANEIKTIRPITPAAATTGTAMDKTDDAFLF